MKRGTPDHPKTRHLASILGLKRYQVVGLLESIWHFTAQYAKRGNIGKWSNEEIAVAVEWDRDPSELINALLVSGFLDACKKNRLLVHDWEEHADQTVCRADEVKKLGFAKRVLEDPSNGEANASQPTPEPEPEPKTKTSAPAAAGHGARGSGYTEDFGEWWAVYPRSEGKLAAFKSWMAAVKRIEGDRQCNREEAKSVLLNATKAFASSPKAKGEYCPHAATWLNQGRYDDDPRTWSARPTAVAEADGPYVPLKG